MRRYSIPDLFSYLFNVPRRLEGWSVGLDILANSKIENIIIFFLQCGLKKALSLYIRIKKMADHEKHFKLYKMKFIWGTSIRIYIKWWIPLLKFYNKQQVVSNSQLIWHSKGNCLWQSTKRSLKSFKVYQKQIDMGIEDL